MAVRADEIRVGGTRPLTTRVRGWLDRESVLGPVFVTPALLLLVLLVAYPFLMALYFAMSGLMTTASGQAASALNIGIALRTPLVRAM